MLKAKTKRNIRIIFIILCIPGIIIVFLGFHYVSQKEYEKQLAAVMDLSTDGAYLSGSAADSSHVYKDIYSVLLKTDADDGSSAYISFVDGTTLDGSVEWLSENSVKLSWTTVQDNEDETTKESVSFKFSNSYPNGFYIISDSEKEIYDYTAVLDRSGEYVLDSEDITDTGVHLTYEDIDDFYGTGTCPEEITELLLDIDGDRESLSSVSSGIGMGEDSSFTYCYTNNAAFMMVHYEEEYYYFRNLRNHWEAAKCEDDEPMFALYSSLFLLASEDTEYLVVWQRSFEGDPYPAIFVSDDYGESFTKLVFGVEISAPEVLDIPYNADILISDEGTMQITLEAHRFSQDAMVIEIPDFDKVMNGTEISFVVKDSVAMPAN